MIGLGAAAAAHDIDDAGAGEFLDHFRHLFRRLVIAAEFVGQAGIGMRRHQGVAGAGKLGDIGAQFARAQGAVQPDGKWVGMAHRMPESGGRLAREGAAGKIGNGAGDPHRQVHAHFLIDFLDRIDRGLAVEGVEHRLDHQQMGAAPDQPTGTFPVGLAQLVESDVAEGRVIDVGRDGGRAVGRAQHAGDQARAAGGGIFVAQFARQPRAGLVQLTDQMAQAIIFLRGEVGVEGVGLDEIHAGFQIHPADVADDFGLGQGEQVIVALQLRRVIAEALPPEILFAQLEALDHHAPAAVQQQQALLGFLLHPGDTAGGIKAHVGSFGAMPRMRQAA